VGRDTNKRLAKAGRKDGTMRKLLLTLILILAVPFTACGGSDDKDGGSSSCAPGCEATVAAACDSGPASQADCESDCESFRSGACAEEYSTLASCGEGKSVTCSDQGVPVVGGCGSEQNAFVACLVG
jgi:hypothetical protein